MSTTRRRPARGTKSRRVIPPMPKSARAPPTASLVSDSDQLLQVLGVGGDHAVYVLDAEGKIATWNPGAERLTGYRSDEVLGRDAALFLPPEAAQSGKAQSDLAIARASGRLEEEGWQVRRGGERYWRTWSSPPSSTTRAGCGVT